MLDSTLRQRGVTLVELMIASAIGLIAIAAILTVYAATVRHSSEQLEAAHLHLQLFGLLHLISTDIRRAGYWQFDTSTQTASDNPFMAGENRMRSQAYPDESDNSCILFAYATVSLARKAQTLITLNSLASGYATSLFNHATVVMPLHVIAVTGKH
jgi:prepilin-type N-terminal cleavage/methylation domain-containing protein